MNQLIEVPHDTPGISTLLRVLSKHNEDHLPRLKKMHEAVMNNQSERKLVIGFMDAELIAEINELLKGERETKIADDHK